MRNRFLSLRSAPVAALALLAIYSRAGDPLEPFRDPTMDERRFVIMLEQRDDESALQVELLIGKTMTVDCKPQSFIGKFSTKKVVRRGYVYYTARDLVIPISPPLACPQNEASRETFVFLGGGPYWVPYDSKVPVVIYVPPGFEVRYRLWSAQDTHREAEQR